MDKKPETNQLTKTTIFSILLILLILIITGFLLALIINFMHGKFSGRLIKISFINSLALAGGVLINLFITRNLIPRVKTQYIFLISLCIIAGVSISGFLYILILEPFFLLYGSSLIKSYFLINFVFALSLTIISSGFLIYQQRLVEKEKVINKERILRKEMEKRLYNAQINPHFLFNSLNLMISLLPTPEKAEQALTTLSHILRYHLDASAKDAVSISSELETIEKYLYLQKLRFEERLTYQISEECDGIIPPLIIQPLVENSVKHNLEKIKNIHIDIQVYKTDTTIVIKIKDSCEAVTESMIGKGTGLTITKKRVELAGGSFSIQDGGIKLEIPWQNRARGKKSD